VRQLKISTSKLTRRTDNISRYFTEVERRHILSPDEEFKVSVLAYQGDETAIEQLIYANLRFVVSVAKQYAGQGLILDDLICQGNIGLCDAARSFDPTRGFRFITYAVWHIRKEILYYLNSDNRQIRIPQNVINDLSKLRRADETILQDKGRYGTLDELQEELSRLGSDRTIEHINRISLAEPRGIALESNDIDDASSPIDWLSVDSDTSDFCAAHDLSKTVNIALTRLSIIQRDIVISRLGIGGREPESFSTISKRYDRTQEWARALYAKSLKLMRVRLLDAKLTSDKIINCEI